MNLPKLAWRNLWRNKRRTLIAVSSLVMAMFLSYVLLSMQEGSYQVMIDSNIRYGTGFIQIHDQGYWEDKSINRLLKDTSTVRNQITEVKHVTEVIPRLQSGGLGLGEKKSRPIAIMGIEPAAEDEISKISKKLVKGDFITSQDSSVLVGKSLAEYLKLEVGDTLVMIGQGYHGVSAAGKYPIKGILKHPSLAIDKQLVYMPLALCQEFHTAENLITTYLINIDEPDKLTQVKQELLTKFGETHEVMTWSDLVPHLESIISQKSKMTALMLGILYLVVGLGIFGTVLMMAMERKREFAVLVAIGMTKKNINATIFLEALLIGLVAIVLGGVLSLPLVYYLSLFPIPLVGEAAASFEAIGSEPVIQFGFSILGFFKQGLVIFIIMLLTTLIPFSLVKNLRVVEAIK